MVVRLEHIIKRIEEIDRDIADLTRMKERVPSNRPFTAGLQVAFDKHINDLLNERISLEELELENPPQDLIDDILSIDVATASRIRVTREEKAEPTAREKNIIEFIRQVPKTEIHLHMEACIARDTLAGLLEQNGIEYKEDEIEQLYKFTNLQEFIKLFLFILDAIKSPDDFELIFNNLTRYLGTNNIRYAEVFFAPSKLIQNGLDFKEMVQTLDRLARDSRLSGGPDVRFLVDVSRTFGRENASKNLQRVISSRVNSVIGIGLGGAELMGPARDFKDVFAQARAEGLRAVAHAGEDDGPWSVRDAVELLRAERIGHGTSVIQDPSLMELIREKQIPIEICLTSNLFTGKYVRRPEDHPVRRYYDDGILCAVNTDDPEIFNVNLTEEYFKFYKHLDFTISEIVDLLKQGVYSSFHPDPASLWKKHEAEILKLRDQFGV